eukprot:TRINITY_DN4941_c0_g1_i7.p1 TRINITY_DN4941_c0_g1~~TRINITY_DN4941_c0_g1_i7.p1  ORF type:complete len:1421 (+),score=262.56 TRINITY_DN4941_c0_g1_i7:76-4338(+)
MSFAAPSARAPRPRQGATKRTVSGSPAPPRLAASPLRSPSGQGATGRRRSDHRPLYKVGDSSPPPRGAESGPRQQLPRSRGSMRLPSAALQREALPGSGGSAAVSARPSATQQGSGETAHLISSVSSPLDSSIRSGGEGWTDLAELIRASARGQKDGTPETEPSMPPSRRARHRRPPPIGTAHRPPSLALSASCQMSPVVMDPDHMTPMHQLAPLQSPGLQGLEEEVPRTATDTRSRGRHSPAASAWTARRYSAAGSVIELDFGERWANAFPDAASPVGPLPQSHPVGAGAGTIDERRYSDTARIPRVHFDRFLNSAASEASPSTRKKDSFIWVSYSGPEKAPTGGPHSTPQASRSAESEPSTATASAPPPHGAAGSAAAATAAAIAVLSVPVQHPARAPSPSALSPAEVCTPADAPSLPSPELEPEHRGSQRTEVQAPTEPSPGPVRPPPPRPDHEPAAAGRWDTRGVSHLPSVPSSAATEPDRTCTEMALAAGRRAFLQPGEDDPRLSPPRRLGDPTAARWALAPPVGLSAPLWGSERLSPLARARWERREQRVCSAEELERLQCAWRHTMECLRSSPPGARRSPLRVASPCRGGVPRRGGTLLSPAQEQQQQQPRALPSPPPPVAALSSSATFGGAGIDSSVAPAPAEEYLRQLPAAPSPPPQSECRSPGITADLSSLLLVPPLPERRSRRGRRSSGSSQSSSARRCPWNQGRGDSPPSRTAPGSPGSVAAGTEPRGGRASASSASVSARQPAQAPSPQPAAPSPQPAAPSPQPAVPSPQPTAPAAEEPPRVLVLGAAASEALAAAGVSLVPPVPIVSPTTAANRSFPSAASGARQASAAPHAPLVTPTALPLSTPAAAPSSSRATPAAAPVVAATVSSSLLLSVDTPSAAGQGKERRGAPAPEYEVVCIRPQPQTPQPRSAGPAPGGATPSSSALDPSGISEGAPRRDAPPPRLAVHRRRAPPALPGALDTLPVTPTPAAPARADPPASPPPLPPAPWRGASLSPPAGSPPPRDGRSPRLSPAGLRLPGELPAQMAADRAREAALRELFSWGPQAREQGPPPARRRGSPARADEADTVVAVPQRWSPDAEQRDKAARHAAADAEGLARRSLEWAEGVARRQLTAAAAHVAAAAAEVAAAAAPRQRQPGGAELPPLRRVSAQPLGASGRAEGASPGRGSPCQWSLRHSLVHLAPAAARRSVSGASSARHGGRGEGSPGRWGEGSPESPACSPAGKRSTSLQVGSPGGRAARHEDSQSRPRSRTPQSPPLTGFSTVLQPPRPPPTFDMQAGSTTRTLEMSDSAEHPRVPHMQCGDTSTSDRPTGRSSRSPLGRGNALLQPAESWPTMGGGCLRRRRHRRHAPRASRPAARGGGLLTAATPERPPRQQPLPLPPRVARPRRRPPPRVARGRPARQHTAE